MNAYEERAGAAGLPPKVGRHAVMGVVIAVLAACSSGGEDASSANDDDTGVGGASGAAGEGGASTGGGDASGGAGGTTTTGGGSGGNGGTMNTGGTNMAGGTGGDTGGDIEVCASRPSAGASCAAIGAQCQVAGSPCGSIFTCNGTWDEEVVCPPIMTDTCPESAPSEGDPCTVNNPIVGLDCRYSDCGNVTATCDGGLWSIRIFPEPECETLCQDLCSRLTDCGVSWAAECLSGCRIAHQCPGSNAEEDAAMCVARAGLLTDADCQALCGNATMSGEFPQFGEACDL